MKKNVKLNNLWVLFLLVLIRIGFTIDYIFNWFDVNKEITIIETIDFLTTIFLTLYVASVLDKRLKQEQFKSDLYVNRICEIENYLHDIKDCIQNKEIPYQSINTKVHTINIANQSLIKSVKELNNLDIDKEDNELKSKYRELKNLLTDRPIDKEDKSVVVKNNLITYNSDRISLIIQVIYEIIEEYFKLKISLNKW
jgi:hypothetical protein